MKSQGALSDTVRLKKLASAWDCNLQYIATNACQSWPHHACPDLHADSHPRLRQAKVTLVDRTHLSGYLSLIFQLIESGRRDLLEAFLENLGKMDVQVLGYVFITDTNPWMLMVAMTV